METRDFKLNIKAIDDVQGTFEGYASTFGPPADLGGDIIERGAFRQAVNLQPEPGYPLLLAHDQSKLVGSVKVAENEHGLHALGTIDLNDELGRSTFGKLQKKMLRGLSIGFLPESTPGSVSYNDDGTRTLKRLRLFEVSLTPVPMNQRAGVVSVKHLGDAVRLLKQADKLDQEQRAELKLLDAEVQRLMVSDPGREQDAALLAELQQLARDLRPPA